MMRFLYNLAFPFVLVALLPSFLVRMLRRGKYRHKFGQRFAIYSPRVRQKLSAGGWIWMHAVSVGEVMIAIKLIREMKSRDPGLQVVLSTTTSTGFALASREKSDWLEPIYNPIDFYFIARRAMRLIRPKQMILVEAEIWPNLSAEAKKHGAKIALVNARLSARSESRYRLVKPFAASLFNQLDLLCVTDSHEIARWTGLGVDESKIRLTGSIKFDDSGDSASPKKDMRVVLSDFGVTADRPILLAGSTHKGEEKVLAAVYQELRAEMPELFLAVVPRHAERAREVLEDIQSLGLKTALRAGEPRPCDCLIVNTTGELRDWYDCSTVVFVGKSLLARGGQNPAEPISAGKAVVFGPNMQNFQALTAQLLREGGAVQVDSQEALVAAIRSLLSDETARLQLAGNGMRCLQQHRGATTRTAELLEERR